MPGRNQISLGILIERADFITLTLEVRKVYNKVARRVLNEEKENTDIEKIEKSLVKSL